MLENNIWLLKTSTEAYSESSQTPMTEIFVKIVNGWKPLTILANISIFVVWLYSKYASSREQNIKSFFKSLYPKPSELCVFRINAVFLQSHNPCVDARIYF